MQMLFSCLLFVVFGLLAPEARADRDTPDYTAAVNLGVAEFEQKNFLEARTNFYKAHRLYANARTFRALGMVEFELKNYAESARYLQQALSSNEKTLDTDKREQAEGLLQRAKGYLGFLTLEVAPETELRVDDVSVEFTPGQQLVLTLGEHKLELNAPGRIGQKRTLNIRGGEEDTLRIVLAEATSPVAASRQQSDSSATRPVYKNPWLWTALGVVVVGAAAGAAVALAHDPGTRTSALDLGSGKKPALVGPSE